MIQYEHVDIQYELPDFQYEHDIQYEQSYVCVFLLVCFSCVCRFSFYVIQKIFFFFRFKMA